MRTGVWKTNNEFQKKKRKRKQTMENWESLDVDDSDLPSLLLRPCKHQRKAATTTPINTTTPSSSSPSSLSHNPQSQTLTSPPPQHAPPYRRRIPGPAGAVQSAMLRRADQRRRPGEDTPPVVSTQECIRKAVENGGVDGDDDEDFKLNPWLCALDFLDRRGQVEGLLPVATPLNSVMKFSDIHKIDLIVAVIKSCTPNGLGDLMVTLKDPTGTVGASIHRKVLADAEFGKDLVVGSLLILQKVAVFAPSRSAIYLNITRSNVVKVISKDSGPPAKQNAHMSAFKPTSIAECRHETRVNVPKMSSLEMDRSQHINIDIGDDASPASSVNNKKEMDVENQGNFLSRGDQSQFSAEQIIRKTFRREITGDEIRNSRDEGQINKEEVRSTIRRGTAGDDQRGSNEEGNHEEEITRRTVVQKERQLPTSIAPVPEWTDEQLNELFASDLEDDGSLF